MPGIWGDGDLLYIYLNILLPRLKWQEQAGWGRGIFPYAQGCEEPFFRPSGKACLWGKETNLLDFREVRSLYGLQEGGLESCSHPLLASKLLFLSFFLGI